MSRLQKVLVIYVLAAAALALVVAYYNLPAGLVCLAGVLGSGFYFLSRQYETRNEVMIGIDRLYKQFDNLNRRRMNQLPVAYVIADADGRIVWYNQAFINNFYPEGAVDLIGRTVRDEFGLDLTACENDAGCEYAHRKIDYQVVTQKIQDSRGELTIINFFDVTLLKRQKEIYSRYEPIFCYMSVDNYDEVTDALTSHERASVLSQVELKITDWVNRKDAFVMHYENDRYLVIFEREKLQVILDAKFHILDEIREIPMNGAVPLTLSIGVGLSDKPLTIKESEEISHRALEIALARGGDQAVVKIDEDIHYYGGKNEATEKRTKVKARVKAQALEELIKDADNILITGHATPDMDCIGAGIGMIDACRALGKHARYVLSGINYSIKAVCEYLAGEDGYQDVFVTHEEADRLVRANTLLIVLDTQASDYLEYPGLLEKIEKKVIIDHHRRPENAVEAPVLAYSEVYASSTCELVSELLQYFDVKRVLSPVGANALMSGIYMDTKLFTSKTGVRTFEAASWLKRRGADMQRAKAFLQDDFETYSRRMRAVQSAEICFEHIAISAYEDESGYAKIIAAQAADEMLNIKGIKASFTIVKNDGQINISGRSNGEINVQLILEGLGGGGHLAMAGAQLRDTDLDAAKALLITHITDYMQDITERKQP